MRTQQRGRRQPLYALARGRVHSFLLRAQQGSQSTGQHHEGRRIVRGNTEQQQLQPVLPELSP